MARTYDPCLIANVLSWVKILVCNKECKRICANGSFSVHVWVSRTSGLLFKTRKIVSRWKKKLRSDLKNCTGSFICYGPWKSLFIQAAKGLRETWGFLGLKGSRTERRNLQRPSVRAAGTCDHIHIKVRLEKIMLFSFQLDGQGYIGSQTLAPEVELDK